MENLSPVDTALKPSLAAVSGANMDRKVERRRPTVKVTIVGAAAASLMAGAYFFLGDQLGSRTFSVDGNRLQTSRVMEGVFEDFIPTRGRVTPRRTVFLDAIEGGRVERRLVEDGAMVEAGDLVVILSNTALQLDVARSEAMVTEQLNNMRTIELQLEQNRLLHRRNLVEIDYQIKRLTTLRARQQELAATGAVRKSDIQDTEDELEYYHNRRAVTLDSQATDGRLQETQLEFLRVSTKQLEDNLAIARRTLDTLNVRAPIAGKLSGFDVEVGQSIARGGRLGQIDDPTSFKLRANVDEFYLDRVAPGQRATFEGEGRTYELTVSKIYPQVKGGQFEIDLLFADEEPESVRRGQSMQLRLSLGDDTPALLVANGSYYQDTGGNWMFVLTADRSEAVRRDVRLGRRNPRYIEVLDGLALGEEVIVSPYTTFKDVDRLRLGD